MCTLKRRDPGHDSFSTLVVTPLVTGWFVARAFRPSVRMNLSSPWFCPFTLLNRSTDTFEPILDDGHIDMPHEYVYGIVHVPDVPDVHIRIAWR